MDLKGANKYRVVFEKSLSSDDISSLTVFYMPCISKTAISLYLLLASEANKRDKDMTIERLCLFLDVGIEKFSTSLTMLEQFRLIRTFYNSDDDTVRFDIQMPLTGAKFISHDVFGRLYLKAVGSSQYDLSCRLHLNQPETSSDKDLEITSGFDISLLNSRWSMEDEEQYKSFNHSSYNAIKEDFDINAFLRNYSLLLMPAEFRTRENLQTIARMATAYSIDIPTMRFYVSNAIDIETGVFDIEALRNMCINSRNVSHDSHHSGYDLPVVEFLSNLQNGIAVAPSDKKSLEYIQLNLQLPKDVINYLVEYVYGKEHRYNRNYVEKIATSWALEGIDTLDKARKNISGFNSRMSRNSTVNFENQNHEASSQDYDKVMAELFRKE